MYRDRIGRILTAAEQHGARVIWMGLPYMRKAELNRQMAYLDEVMRSETAESALALFIPTKDLLSVTGAYSDKSPVRTSLHLREDQMAAAFSTEGRALVFNTALLAPKTSRASQGVGVMTLKPKYRLDRACPLKDTTIVNLSRYRVRSVPAAGALLKDEDRGEKQMTLLEE